jgi:activator of HSP90 ATPase
VVDYFGFKKNKLKEINRNFQDSQVNATQKEVKTGIKQVEAMGTDSDSSPRKRKMRL